MCNSLIIIIKVSHFVHFTLYIFYRLVSLQWPIGRNLAYLFDDGHLFIYCEVIQGKIIKTMVLLRRCQKSNPLKLKPQREGKITSCDVKPVLLFYGCNRY